MAKLSKLLVLCVLFCLVAFVERAPAEVAKLAVVQFRDAPFKELIGKTKIVYVLPESGTNRLSIAMKADIVGDFKSPGARVIKQSDFGWLETRTEGRLVRFFLPTDDAILFLPAPCDSDQRLCRGDTVFDMKATASAHFELEDWESMAGSISKIDGVFMNAENEPSYVLLSNGRLSSPSHLLKLRCSGESKKECEFIER